MITPEYKFEVFFRLQQIILDSDDDSNLIGKLLLQSNILLSVVGLDYNFLSVLILDENLALKWSFYIEPSNLPADPSSSAQNLNASSFINTKALLNPAQRWIKELLWGQSFTENVVADLV